jgi:hypothetical protein
MPRSHTRITLLAVALFGLVLGHAGQTPGEDFRVDNVVSTADPKEPSSESTTIFRAGVVYDFMKTPAETVVFDSIAGRFVLLNLTRKTRTELTTNEVAAFVDRLQPLAAKSPDPLVKFLAAPKFQEQADEKAGELSLSSRLVNYRISLSREASPEMVAEYRGFCDWYARLNALLVPGSRPPFGRLVVNAALAQRQATASQVSLTMSSGKGPNQQRTTIRSEHHFVQPLTQADLDQVTQTGNFMTSFKPVSFDEYRKVDMR